MRRRKADGKHGKHEGVKTGKTRSAEGFKADGRSFLRQMQIESLRSFGGLILRPGL